MSFLFKFGIACVLGVLLGIGVIVLGIALGLLTLAWIGLGILILPAVAMAILLVCNEVYEVRNDIPFQW